MTVNEGLISHHPVEEVRRIANLELDPKRKGAFGQFMTPLTVARFMAGLFERWNLPEVRLLDAGAGVGSLTAAFLDVWLAQAPHGAAVTATTYEIDGTMRRHLSGTLEAYRDAVHRRGFNFHAEIVDKDFIAGGSEQMLPLMGGRRFTHAILNPPYKKMNNDSDHRRMLREVGIETVNLYTGFLAVALALLEPGGELVAIVPRSFCNGAYYRPFRAWMRERAALTHLHLFESRRKAFEDDEVLQENIIARWVSGARQEDVVVSWCEDASFTDVLRHIHPFAAIVQPDDPEGYIHIPAGKPQAVTDESPLFSTTLKELGLTVSTGPVVDFRLREHLRKAPEAGTVPLLYPQHFARGGLRWPLDGRKPNAILVNDVTNRWLFPRGRYVVTKRFTSKEEARRLVAHVVEPDLLPGERLGLENHLNLFHAERSGLGPDLAHGLSVFLNSTLVDQRFRVFSGHTQVNATDLRQMRYPPLDMLLEFGTWARSRDRLDQATIDRFVERYV